jgi:hypothetical protein
MTAMNYIGLDVHKKTIKRENCPSVSPNGRNASSNRRASARAARCT